MQKTLAFIGGGNMAASFVGGLIADHYDPQKLWVSSPNKEKLAKLSALCKGIHITSNNSEAVKQADIILITVKPQLVHTVIKELKPVIAGTQKLVISIAAGVRTVDLQRWLGGHEAIVRCMPNTPALIGCGATGMYAIEGVSPEQKDLSESIMRSLGITLWLENEHLLDAITALSGSGPAYFFLVMETLVQAAEGLGLKKDEARLMILQTAVGSARMALESGEDLARLRQQVTSPGGTTEQALRALESGGLRQLFTHALYESNRRAEELASMFSQLD